MVLGSFLTVLIWSRTAQGETTEPVEAVDSVAPEPENGQASVDSVTAPAVDSVTAPEPENGNSEEAENPSNDEEVGMQSTTPVMVRIAALTGKKLKIKTQS